MEFWSQQEMFRVVVLLFFCSLDTAGGLSGSRNSFLASEFIISKDAFSLSIMGSAEGGEQHRFRAESANPAEELQLEP